MNDDKSDAPGPTLSEAAAMNDPKMNDLRLGAARKRLAESRDREDAIEGLREIVANFLGSEEMGLFRVDRGTASLQVYWSFGIDPEKYDLLWTIGDAGLRRVMGGECHVEFAARESSGVKTTAQAFIPIRFANQTIAILAIFHLLPQKLAFDKSDMELFKIISDEAAQPLFGTSAYLKPVTEGPGIRA
ncbi:MAG: hypothetical protein WBD25_02810 [Terriglobales bacterium]